MIFFSFLFLAVTGYAAGECYRNVQAHPGVGKTIIGYSIVGGMISYAGLLLHDVLDFFCYLV